MVRLKFFRCDACVLPVSARDRDDVSVLARGESGHLHLAGETRPDKTDAYLVHDSRITKRRERDALTPACSSFYVRLDHGYSYFAGRFRCTARSAFYEHLVHF